MSAHTVRRAVLEGGIAADIQLGYEVSQAESESCLQQYQQTLLTLTK